MQATFPEATARPILWSAPPPRPEAAAPQRAHLARVEPLLGALLDELDYGVLLLLREDAGVIHANRAARQALGASSGIELADGKLRTHREADAQLLHDALAGAQRGLRRLLTLGVAGQRVAVALIPIGTPLPGGPELIAAVCGRRRLCEHMSMEWFARAHGLTPAESRVLELLCEGLDPRDIAAANEVGMATVRTQVNSIRDKTGAASIRVLLQRLAMLPPMVSSLRC